MGRIIGLIADGSSGGGVFASKGGKVEMNGITPINCSAMTNVGMLDEILLKPTAGKFYQKTSLAYAFNKSIDGMVFGLAEYPYKPIVL